MRRLLALLACLLAAAAASETAAATGTHKASGAGASDDVAAAMGVGAVSSQPPPPATAVSGHSGHSAHVHSKAMPRFRRVGGKLAAKAKASTSAKAKVKAEGGAGLMTPLPLLDGDGKPVEEAKWWQPPGRMPNFKLEAYKDGGPPLGFTEWTQPAAEPNLMGIPSNGRTDKDATEPNQLPFQSYPPVNPGYAGLLPAAKPAPKEEPNFNENPEDWMNPLYSYAPRGSMPNPFPRSGMHAMVPSGAVAPGAGRPPAGRLPVASPAFPRAAAVMEGMTPTPQVTNAGLAGSLPAHHRIPSGPSPVRFQQTSARLTAAHGTSAWSYASQHAPAGALAAVHTPFGTRLGFAPPSRHAAAAAAAAEGHSVAHPPAAAKQLRMASVSAKRDPAGLMAVPKEPSNPIEALPMPPQPPDMGLMNVPQGYTMHPQPPQTLFPGTAPPPPALIDTPPLPAASPMTMAAPYGGNRAPVPVRNVRSLGPAVTPFSFLECVDKMRATVHAVRALHAAKKEE